MCCAGCTKALKKDTKKYLDIMAKRGEKPALLQTVCPVMGGKINKQSYVDHDGKRIYMCCAGCAGALKKDPGKYIKKLEDSGVVLDRVPEKKTKKKSK